MINSTPEKRQIVMICDAGHFQLSHSITDFKKFKPKLVQNRHHFTVSTASDYFTPNGLAKQTGQSPENFGNVVLKELLDNALDACEAAGINPEITIAYTDGVLSITDNGLGLPAHIVESTLDFGVRISDKALYKSSTRGCQGQALKTIIGIAYLSGKPLVIEAQGVRHEIAPTATPIGTIDTGYTTSHCDWAIGTMVRIYVDDVDIENILFVKNIVNPHVKFTMFNFDSKSPKSLVFYKCEKIKPNETTSIHWYSADDFYKLAYSHSIQHDIPLGEFIRGFRGLSSTKTAKSLATGYKRTSDITADREAVDSLYHAMRSLCKPIQPKALGAIGAEIMLSRIEQRPNLKHWYKKAEILHNNKPYVFEILIAQAAGIDGIHYAINHSFAFGDFLSGQYMYSDRTKPGGYGISGVLGFLSEYSITVICHLIGVGLQFKDWGKATVALDRPVINQIYDAIVSVSKEPYKRYKADIRADRASNKLIDESEKNNTLWTKRAAIFDLLPKAIALATDGGTLPCNERGLLYKVRPLFQGYEIKDNKPLTYPYFSQVYHEYCRIHGSNHLIYNDSRGTLIEPFTDGSFQLSTLDVRNYVIPKHHFNKVLFIEKKGLLQVLMAVNIHKRFDMALIGSEGFATVAIRDLLSKMQLNENYTIFVLHDADPAGYEISRTLQEATTRMPNHSIDVIDIGLTIADAITMGLEPETFTRKQELSSKLNLTPLEHEYFDGTRCGKNWTDCRRFELNAMSSRQLVNYVEAALLDSSTSKKVIPPDDVVVNKAKEKLAASISLAIQKQLEATFDLKALKGKIAENFESLTDGLDVESYLDKHEAEPWQNAVDSLMTDRIDSVKNEMMEVIIKGLS